METNSLPLRYVHEICVCKVVVYKHRVKLFCRPIICKFGAGFMRMQQTKYISIGLGPTNAGKSIIRGNFKMLLLSPAYP